MNVLAFDTSNYTTSVAVFDGTQGHNVSRLLDVEQGSLGLRQSDALFAHIKRLPELTDRLFSDIGKIPLEAVGVSTRPRAVEGSYMPCFLAGKTIAESVGHVLDVPVYSFSHQQGHIAAGLFSCGRTDLLEKPFYAFHLSGGTLELVMVNGIDKITIVGETLDLTAGQLIDRIGVKAGLPFPAGAKLDELSRNGSLPKKTKIVLKDGNCCLSGFENMADDLLKKGTDIADVAVFLFDTVGATVFEMVRCAREKYGNYPCLFVGGVMANTHIRQKLKNADDVYFAEPALSADNAVGIALLTKLRHGGEII